MWEYFEEKTIVGKERVNCTLCNWSKTKNQSMQMKSHLAKSHVEAYQVVKEKENLAEIGPLKRSKKSDGSSSTAQQKVTVDKVS